MKAKEFNVLLLAYANLIEEACGSDQAASWRALLPIFELNPVATVSDVCKTFKGLEVSDDSCGSTIQQFIDLATYVEKCLKASAKQDVIKDFRRFTDSLVPFAKLPIAQFVDLAVARLRQPVAPKRRAIPELSPEEIQQYVHRLEKALGDEEAFADAFSDLKKDPGVKAPVAKQIARDFARKSGRSKTEAFDLIWARHASIAGVKARAEATAGRTAA